MKNKKIFKAMLSIIIILLSLFSIGYLAYSLTFYEGVETFYRIYAIVILIYFFLLLSYLELRSIKKKSMKSFLIPAFISIVFISAELYGSYYLKKIYKSMNYTDNSNIKYFSKDCYFDMLNKILIKDNINIKLTNKESDLLTLLCENSNHFVSYDLIASIVWDDSFMSEDALRTLARKLRKKLPQNCLENFSKVGYKIVTF